MFLILITVNTNCTEPEEACAGTDDSIKKENLIKIIPLQTTYNQGDFIKISITIPNNNNIFGYPINLLGLTYDYTGNVFFKYFSTLIDNNVLTTLKGSQKQMPNYFGMFYNNNNGNYELELKIKLNRLGIYSFETLGKEEIIFKGNCSEFLIKTNIEGANSSGKIEFIVI